MKKFLLFILTFFAASVAFLLIGGAGIGWLLHRIWPAIETGTGILIGVVTIGIVVQVFAKTISSVLSTLVPLNLPVEQEWDEYVDEPPRRPSRKRSRRHPKREEDFLKRDAV